MLKNHFLLALRQLRQRPMFSIILIAGLTIGLAAALLVSTIVINDLSYDRQWSKKDRIFRVNTRSLKTGETRAGALAGLTPELRHAMPEVEDFCRMWRRDKRYKLTADEQGIETGTIEAEEGVWNLLDLKVVEGNPRQLVSGETNLVITETLRNRYFRNQNPVGRRIVSLNNYGSPDTVLITGVIRDLPQNSHLRAEAIQLRHFAEKNNSLSGPGEGNTLQAYILLRPATNLARFTAKTNEWFKKRLKEYAWMELSFQPIQDVYLRSDAIGNQEIKGSIRTVFILSGVAALLLLIACINFINLSTAAALKRSKATGIRKVLGAARTTLMRQFLVESLVYFSLSFVLAVMLFIASFPVLESFTGNSLPLGVNKQWSVFAGTAGAVLLVTLTTGLYPAWSLSKPQAVTAFNHSGKAGRGAEFFRRSLVTLQFSISIVLLIAALVVHRQFRLLDDAPIGYDKNDLIVADWMEWGNNVSAFRNELAEVSGVKKISLARWIPGKGGGSMNSLVKDPENPDKMMTASFISGDVSLPQTLGLTLLQGRWLSEDYGADAPNFDSLMRQGMDAVDKLATTESDLITASAARRLGIRQLGVPVKGLSGIPVGIVSDFRNESYKAQEGICLIQAQSRATYGGMLIKVSPGSSPRVKAAFARLFRKYYPSLLLKLDDVSDLVAAQYATEKKLMQIFYFFSGLIVFLSCMGLFGLVTFMVQSHVREIGIRKVLGASTEHITAMLTWNFLRLVLLAALLAIPAGAWLMNRWLRDYPYRTGLSWWLFVLPLAAASLVATLTVGVQSVKAAMANPADALRAE